MNSTSTATAGPNDFNKNKSHPIAKRLTNAHDTHSIDRDEFQQLCFRLGEPMTSAQAPVLRARRPSHMLTSNGYGERGE